MLLYYNLLLFSATDKKLPNLGLVVMYARRLHFMPMVTVGSDETILLLIAIFEKRNNPPVDLAALWCRIALYRHRSGEYNFYSALADYDPSKPEAEFANDVMNLIHQGKIEGVLGGVKTTSLGRFFVYGLCLPESLQSILDISNEEVQSAFQTKKISRWCEFVSKLRMKLFS
jgi:hypothetical protein